MCVDTTLVSGHSPFYPKLVLALCSPYESYQNQFWLYCPPIGRPLSAALLLGGPLGPYELCHPIGRPFGPIWALPSYWAPLLRHFSAAQLQGWAGSAFWRMRRCPCAEVRKVYFATQEQSFF